YLARLMGLHRDSDALEDRLFRDLPECLMSGDLLVVNHSKVVPARIVGVKQPTGAVCELLLLRQVKGDQWECLAKPGKRMHPGNVVTFGDGTLPATADETMEDGNKLVTFRYDTETLYEKLDAFGRCRCPPTSPSSWRTRASTRPSTPRSWAAPPPRRRGSTSPPS